jgi:membrane protein YqaA with SNARE-associated domain
MNTTDADLDYRSILWKSFQVLLALVLLSAAVGFTFRESILELGHGFVERWGGPGILLGFFLPDAFAVPIPHDLFLLLGVAGDMPRLEIVAWATTGSLLGGTTAWCLAQVVRAFPPLARRLEARSAAAQALIERHGVKALAIGALTPLP